MGVWSIVIDVFLALQDERHQYDEKNNHVYTNLGNHPFHNPSHHLASGKLIVLGISFWINTLTERNPSFEAIMSSTSSRLWTDTFQSTECGTSNDGWLALSFKKRIWEAVSRGWLATHGLSGTVIVILPASSKCFANSCRRYSESPKPPTNMIRCTSLLGICTNLRNGGIQHW